MSEPVVFVPLTQGKVAEIEAARAYDAYVNGVFGEFASPNFSL